MRAAALQRDRDRPLLERSRGFWSIGSLLHAIFLDLSFATLGVQGHGGGWRLAMAFYFAGSRGPTHVPGGRSGNSRGQSVEHALQHALAQFLGLSVWADKPVDQQQSEAMHERPEDQDGRSDLPLVSRCLRKGAPQGAVSDRIREEGLRLLGRGNFDGGAVIIRPGEVAAKHQAVESRILNAMTHVVARDSE